MIEQFLYIIRNLMRVRRPMWTLNFRSLVSDTFSRIAKYRMREKVLYSASSEIDFYTAKAHFYLRLYDICHICSVLVSQEKRITLLVCQPLIYNVREYFTWSLKDQVSVINDRLFETGT